MPMVRAHERVDLAVGRFNALIRLDTDDAVFAMRRIGEALAALHREAYDLAFERPVPEECTAYAESLAPLEGAVPETGDGARAARDAMEQAGAGFEHMVFPNRRHTMRNTELAFVEDQAQRERAHAAQHPDDAHAQAWASETARIRHALIYESCCVPHRRR